MKEYKIGDKPWFANFSYQEIKLPCPACYGKLKIKVILGNDEEVIMDCNSCNRGYEGSIGYITEGEWSKDVRQVEIEEMDAKDTLHEGRKVESYRFYNGYVRPEDNKLFDTKEEAEKRANELFEEYELTKQESIKRKKEDPSKTYGWHVRYHSREIKELERKLEYHKKKLIICKENNKVKEKPPERLENIP